MRSERGNRREMCHVNPHWEAMGRPCDFILSEGKAWEDFDQRGDVFECRRK